MKNDSMFPTAKRRTAKSLGFKVGDLVFTGMFPAVLIQGATTTTPMCEVYGLEHEMGSVYADDLVKITPEAFKRMLESNGYNGPLHTYSTVAKKALEAIGVATS